MRRCNVIPPITARCSISPRRTRPRRSGEGDRVVRRRSEAGGWHEEAWYTQYTIGLIFKDAGDVRGAIHAFVVALRRDRRRPEPYFISPPCSGTAVIFCGRCDWRGQASLWVSRRTDRSSSTAMCATGDSCGNCRLQRHSHRIGKRDSRPMSSWHWASAHRRSLPRWRGRMPSSTLNPCRT